MNGEDWSLKMESVDGYLNMGIKEWAWTLGQRCIKKKPKKHRKLKSLKTTIRNGFETIFYVYNYIYIYILFNKIYNINIFIFIFII